MSARAQLVTRYVRNLSFGLLILLSAFPQPVLAADKLRVVASFSILADLVREVGGDAVEVTSLVGPGGDAHVFQPSPADARAVAQTDLMVVNGLGFEGWIDRLITASGYSGPVVVASEGVTPLHLADEERIAATHGGGGTHHHSEPGTAVDPHAWQDVRNTIHYVQTILEALRTASPERAASFASNAARYLHTLQALDTAVRRATEALPPDRRRIITSHDAFGYFGAAYGISFLAPVGFSTESEPAASDVAALIRQVRAQGVHAIFVENARDPRLVQQIARETGATVGGELFSDSLSPPDGPAGTYVTMMQHNTQSITSALGS